MAKKKATKKKKAVKKATKKKVMPAGQKVPKGMVAHWWDNDGVQIGHAEQGRTVHDTSRGKWQITDPTVEQKLSELLVRVGGHDLRTVNFGRGQHGYSTTLYTKNCAVLQLDLIKKKDGTWRLKTELSEWLVQEFERAGFTIAKRKSASNR